MYMKEAAVVKWLSYWFAEQGIRGSIPALATRISEIEYLLLPSRDMAERLLTQRKTSKQPNNMYMGLDCCIRSGTVWRKYKLTNIFKARPPSRYICHAYDQNVDTHLHILEIKDQLKHTC